MAFVDLVSKEATNAGGRVTIVNRALTPLIVPGERAVEADHATQLLLVSEYPSKGAGEQALANGKNTHKVRTFEATPVGGIGSLIGRTLPSILGLFSNVNDLGENDAQQLASLIEASHILKGAPETGLYDDHWASLVEQSRSEPIWMLNFLEYKEQADHGEASDYNDVITDQQAYQQYSSGMIGSLAAVGGKVGWSGYMAKQIGGEDDGHWHEIIFAVYRSTVAMMTMLAMDGYRAAHHHRIAGLARTRLLATQPIENGAIVNQ